MVGDGAALSVEGEIERLAAESFADAFASDRGVVVHAAVTRARSKTGIAGSGLALRLGIIPSRRRSIASPHARWRIDESRWNVPPS
jgi:hypothetical protein